MEILDKLELRNVTVTILRTPTDNINASEITDGAASENSYRHITSEKTSAIAKITIC